MHVYFSFYTFVFVNVLFLEGLLVAVGIWNKTCQYYDKIFIEMTGGHFSIFSEVSVKSFRK